MRGKALTIGLCLVVGLAMAACNDATEDLEVFGAVLDGQSEVPSRPTAGNGSAQFVSDGTTVRYSLEVDDVNNMFMAHIHLAPAGVNGPIRVWLQPVGATVRGPSFSVTDKTIFEGTFTQANVQGGVSLADVLAAMRNGGAYVNVHSDQFPGGEIRGQISVTNVD
jgi:CHRD domain-containing protein